MRMKVYERAVVEFNDDDTAALETIHTRTNEAGEVTEIPPKFPLRNARVVFNGDQASVSIPVPGKRAMRICRLTQASLSTGKGDDGPVTISGNVPELADLGFEGADAQITAVVKKYARCATCS